MDSSDHLFPAYHTDEESFASEEELVLAEKSSAQCSSVPDDAVSITCASAAAVGKTRGSNCDGQKELKQFMAKFEFVKPEYRRLPKKTCLNVCLTYCKYLSVQRVLKRLGFEEVDEGDNWHMMWTDCCISLAQMIDMKKFQKVNHFPGMVEICRKDMLARNLKRMQRSFFKDYNFVPRTWCLPAEYAELQTHAKRHRGRSYIVKPESGCQGRGIWVTRNASLIPSTERLICQQYVTKPFMIDGFKFDLRIYVLVTSVDPLRIYVFKDGLARFCTVKYVKPSVRNADNVFMHLTNYAVNKSSDQFVRNDEANGSKRRICTINKWLLDRNYNVVKLWAAIDDLIVKTLLSACASLRQNYISCFHKHDYGPACFEILGFDILLDHRLKPYLLEVNHSPSFSTDSDIDCEVKEALINDTVHLINFEAADRRKCLEEERRKMRQRLTSARPPKQRLKEPSLAVGNETKMLEELMEYELQHIGNFRRVYPPTTTTTASINSYEKFMQMSGSICQDTAAERARKECSRLQREAIRRKQEENELRFGCVRNRLRTESCSSERIQKTTVSSPEPMTTLPVDIIDREEKRRVESMTKRGILIRNMGIPRLVERMLDTTGKTTSHVEPAVSDVRPGSAVDVVNSSTADAIVSSAVVDQRRSSSTFAPRFLPVSRDVFPTSAMR